MNINCKKTKEIIIGPLSKDSDTLSISSVCWMRLDLQAVGRYDQYVAEVGRSYWCNYDLSSKETLVSENTQAGRCNGWWSCTVLSNCCKTSLGIYMPIMAFQFVEAAGKISWERSTPSSADHSWQYSNTPVVCSIFSRWQTDDPNCVEHCSDRLLTTSPTVCIICCLQSVTLTWLAVYGDQWHYYLLLYACMLVCVCECVLFIVLIQPLTAIHNKWCM